MYARLLVWCLINMVGNYSRGLWLNPGGYWLPDWPVFSFSYVLTSSQKKEQWLGAKSKWTMVELFEPCWFGLIKVLLLPSSIWWKTHKLEPISNLFSNSRRHSPISRCVCWQYQVFHFLTSSSCFWKLQSNKLVQSSHIERVNVHKGMWCL